MKKITIVIVLTFIISFSSFSQNNSYIKNRWNFKAGYARYLTGNKINNKEETTGNFRVECNYGIIKYLETGIYLGYSNFEFITDILLNQEKYFTPFYGMNLNFHILPFLVKEDNFRFDLYITGKLGGRYFTTPDYYAIHGHYTEYGLGGGISFYLWDHLGLYAEYCIGKYHFRENIKDNTKLRYGIAFKF